MRFAWLFGTGAFVGGVLSGGQVAAHGIGAQAQSHAKLVAEGYTKLRAGIMPSHAELRAMGLNEPEARGKMALFQMENIDGAGDYQAEGVSVPSVTGSEEAVESVELTVRDEKFLDADGNIDWKTWAPNGGRVPGTIQEGQTLAVGTIIDRYGNPYGKYASPMGVPYEQRALPYTENSAAYHRYEVLKPINDVVISQIAEAFEQPGRGTQYELPTTIHQLIKEGYLREIVE